MARMYCYIAASKPENTSMGYKGGRLCGEVRYETSAEQLWVCHCHCSKCRKQTGAAVGTFVGFPAGSVRWLARNPERYRSSEDVERSFCPTCGSSIGFHRAHETSLSIGSFDHPEDVVTDESFRLHVMHREHIDWFDTADDWPRYEKFGPGKEDEIKQLSGQPIKD
ncbi:MAG: GFA family protein [Paracoccaceae bacterium]|nr:GFA family protein [Paracoccaceae bacterium]